MNIQHLISCTHKSQPSSPIHSERHDAMSQQTSPAPDIDAPFEDESDLLDEENNANNEEEEEGEELFGDNMEA